MSRIRTRTIPLILLAGVAIADASPSSRTILIEARNLAYDANYRNDQAGLQYAITALKPPAEGADAAHAHYYLSWTYGALSGSQFFASDGTSALRSANQALEHARRAVALRDKDSDFHVALANALVAVMILDRAQFEKAFAELKEVRTRAIALGPRNPRVVLMDAGILFNDPTEQDGQERGIARLQQALSLFETEAEDKSIDPLAPRWGHAPAYGVLANFYMRVSLLRRSEHGRQPRPRCKCERTTGSCGNRCCPLSRIETSRVQWQGAGRGV